MLCYDTLALLIAVLPLLLCLSHHHSGAVCILHLYMSGFFTFANNRSGEKAKQGICVL